MPSADALSIEAARSQDASAIAALAATTPYGGWSEASVMQELEKPISRVDCAWRDGALLGFYVLWIVAEEAELMLMVVDETHRRQGLGGALLKALEARAIFERCDLVRLEVAQKNTSAIRLYERFGFARVGVREGYYADGDDAIQMVKAL